MARNIALTLTIDGVEQTISTIGQLEEAIKQAKTQLSGLEIGSKEFQKLQTQIRQADGALKNLQERTEGKKIEETIGRYAKIGSAITGSFAAAQAAFALFGSESENISKAAAQAQNLLTIALVGREVAEGSVAAATLIADLATKAQTASTIAADSATKRFYATLAANPYTALLIGVGLLIAAIVTLTSRTDDAKKKQIELQKAVDESASKEIAKLKILKQTLESETATREQKKQAIEDAKKQFGPYLETLDQEKLLTGEITIEYDKLTDALIRKAKAEAFSGEIAKLALKELELKRQLTKATNDQTKAQQNLRDAETISRGVTGGGSVPGVGGAQTTGIVERQRVITIDKEVDRLQKELNRNLEEQTVLTEEVTKANEANFNILGSGTEKLEENNKELKVNEELIQNLIKTYGQFNLALFQLGESNVDIELSLQKQIDEVTQLVKGLEDLDTIEEKLVALNKTLSQQNDAVGDAFELVRIKSEGFFNTLKKGKTTQDEVKASGEKLRQEALLIAEELKLSPENTAQLEKYVLLYTQFTDAVAKFQTTNITPPFDAAKFERDLVDVQLLTGKIKVDPYSFLDPSKPDYKPRQAEDLQRELLDAQERLQRDQEAFVKSYIQLRKKEAQKEIQGLNAAELVEFEKTLGEAGKVAFENLVNVGNQVIIFEDGIENVRLNVEKLNAELAKLEPQAKRALIVENIDLIADQYQGILQSIELNEENVLALKEKIRNRDYSEEEKYRDTLVKLQESLLGKGIDISTLSYEEKLKLLESFLTKEVEAVENAEKKKVDATNESLEKIAKAIQTFQAILTSIQQTTADYYAFQLDRLDKQNESLQSKIVGDTEQANKKRIELEEIYQNKRKELEKKQAKTALGLQLVQGVSNTALAIIRALAEAGPIAGPILAGIIGSIGAVQVGIIGAQLAQVDQFKRGGMLAMGGMVNGPSHEYGGVKFQGGGFELEGNEAVINRRSSLNYMGLLSQINQSGGGVPIYNNFDDSRIVEAIYKQRNEPIRAFVVESDITNKQQITRRLEQLSQF